MAQPGNQEQRRPYNKPQLRQYGDLRRLTETDIAGSASADGGMYGNADTKTSG